MFLHPLIIELPNHTIPCSSILSRITYRNVLRYNFVMFVKLTIKLGY